MERQRDRLFAALTHVVAQLESETLLPYLRDLGRDHRKFLVGPEHYAAVGASLLAALAQTSGEAWTPVVEKAWTEAYQVIADAMTAGAAASAEPPGGTPRWCATCSTERTSACSPCSRTSRSPTGRASTSA